ncbi:MAG: hypothetical protein A2Y10_03740 [Planctomycetes bacterium GWF2_41_51]|nr:MAG: hypothetical protein A2Y10_03740 [Planctomycetes bacterium GWF2_41_51]HBG26047.1 hypothetical protein [Phycisphaerales bacterium]
MKKLSFTFLFCVLALTSTIVNSAMVGVYIDEDFSSGLGSYLQGANSNSTSQSADTDGSVEVSGGLAMMHPTSTIFGTEALPFVSLASGQSAVLTLYGMTVTDDTPRPGYTMIGFTDVKDTLNTGNTGFASLGGPSSATGTYMRMYTRGPAGIKGPNTGFSRSSFADGLPHDWIITLSKALDGTMSFRVQCEDKDLDWNTLDGFNGVSAAEWATYLPTTAIVPHIRFTDMDSVGNGLLTIDRLVYEVVPEPATIVLLGMGLALLRKK